MVINVEWVLNLEMAFDESPTRKLGNHESIVWLFVDPDPDPDPFVVLVLVIGDALVGVPVVGGVGVDE